MAGRVETGWAAASVWQSAVLGKGGSWARAYQWGWMTPAPSVMPAAYRWLLREMMFLDVGSWLGWPWGAVRRAGDTIRAAPIQRAPRLSTENGGG